jgi:hypothetical protein
MAPLFVLLCCGLIGKHGPNISLTVGRICGSRGFVVVCLSYIKCSSAVLEVHKQNIDSSNSVNIFHQNIRGFRSKSDELIHSFEVDTISPHILCLSKHHVVEQELLHLTINCYPLGSSFCRKGLQRGGVCIFARTDQHFSKIDISHHCKEQDFEICAIHLVTKTSNLIILSLYGTPSGDVNECLGRLDATLNICTIQNLSS